MCMFGNGEDYTDSIRTYPLSNNDVIEVSYVSAPSSSR